jgi:hypothetical protein
MTDPLLFAKIRREVYDSMNAKEERRIKSDRHQWDDNPAMNDWEVGQSVIQQKMINIK